MPLAFTLTNAFSIHTNTHVVQTDTSSASAAAAAAVCQPPIK